MQLRSGNRNAIRRSSLDDAYHCCVNGRRSPLPQLQPIFSKLGAGGCIVLLWLEKAAWLEPAVSGDRSRAWIGPLHGLWS